MRILIGAELLPQRRFEKSHGAESGIEREIYGVDDFEIWGAVGGCIDVHPQARYIAQGHETTYQ